MSLVAHKVALNYFVGHIGLRAVERFNKLTFVVSLSVVGLWVNICRDTLLVTAFEGQEGFA